LRYEKGHVVGIVVHQRRTMKGHVS
jgi:hypothetical protein